MLHVGCGNSILAVQMAQHGYERIVNVDISRTVIEHMAERWRAHDAQLQWLVCDVKAMRFGDGAFGCVLDKGTLDAVLAEKGDCWELDESVAAEAHAYLAECARVLRRGGCFLYITFGQPHFRKLCLLDERLPWTLESTATVGDTWHYYVYVLRKK